jgi:predicted permease
MISDIFQDFRYSARVLRKNPVFTLIAAVTLALGIGANTAIFSIIDVLAFRPLPVTKPHELMRIFGGEPKGNPQSATIAWPTFQAYREHTTAFTGLAAYVDRFPVNLSAGKFGGERLDAGMVTGNYFQLLGINAAKGRTLLPQDDQPGAPPAIVLGYRFWRRHFSDSSNALGTQVSINGQSFTVVGIAPQEFGGISFETFPEVWIPMSHAFEIDPILKSQIPLGHESFAPFGAIGRLKPGVTPARAQAQLESIASQRGAGKTIAAEGGFTPPWPALVSVTDAARQTTAQMSFLLLGIVTLVLFIACVDVAGLMLARSEARQKEIAVRMALGASRTRIAALHISEALLISGVGATFGLLLANWGTQLLLHVAPEAMSLPLRRTSSVLDIRVLAFTAIVALASAFISTLLPAFKYSRPDLPLAIRDDSWRAKLTGRKLSAQSVLVVMQIAASVLLLTGAGLLTRTLWHASQIRLGFRPEHTVVASVDLIRQGYDKNAAANMLDRFLDSLRAQPGVEAAALGDPPLQPSMTTTVDMGAHQGQSIQLSRVSSGYFTTVGIPLVSGRDFAFSDAANAPGVAIVTESLARKYWPRESALGKHIENVGIHDQSFEVIGVVGDTAASNVRRESTGIVYFPLSQSYLMFPWQPNITLLAHGPADTSQLTTSIRNAVSSVDSTLPIFHVRTLNDQVAEVIGREKFLARLLQIFSLLAVTLAVAGVFGVTSYTTERSIHDFGIRMALGAQRAHVLWLVLRKGLIFSMAGVAVGVGASFWLTRLLVSALFGVTPHDPATFIAVSAAIVVITLGACYLPARRATRVDPMVALRAE